MLAVTQEKSLNGTADSIECSEDSFEGQEGRVPQSYFPTSKPYDPWSHFDGEEELIKKLLGLT